MASRIRLPGTLIALFLGGAAAICSLALCMAVGAILAQQVLVAGSPAEWAAPGLATMLGVLSSLGPVGFYNETAEGAIGLGIEAAALPWALVAASPAVFFAQAVGRWARESRVAEIAFALGYGVSVGLGVGLLATWSVAVEPDLKLPVSPDLVAGRSALIALTVVVMVQLRQRLGRLGVYVHSVLVGALALAVTMVVVWLVGLVVAIVQAPTEVRQGVTTAGALVGGNASAASLFSSLGVATDVTIRSPMTESVENYTLAGVTGLPSTVIALTGTAIVVASVLAAFVIAVRGVEADLPRIWPVIGVSVGLAGAGAALASVVSGNLDLVILPIDATQRSFSEIEFAVDAGTAFTQLGARALFVGLPFVLLGERRGQEVAPVDTGIEPVTEQLRVGHEV